MRPEPRGVPGWYSHQLDLIFKSIRTKDEVSRDQTIAQLAVDGLENLDEIAAHLADLRETGGRIASALERIAEALESGAPWQVEVQP